MKVSQTMKSVILFSFLLTGCGTINTTFVDKVVTKRKLHKADTYCESLPRIYSGVAYDFCILHAEPASTAENVYNQNVGVPLITLDFFFSGLADTLFLPYGIYKQSTEGNIPLKKCK